MYAMLTGRLPFTVEPFNIAALHAKMLENKMEPIPDHISSSKTHQDVVILLQLLYCLFRLQGSHVQDAEPQA